MSEIDDVKQQVLDGKTFFELKDFPVTDPDTFMSMIVEPLRKLRRAGMFDKTEELWNHADGESYIFAVEITTPINFNFEKDDA